MASVKEVIEKRKYDNAYRKNKLLKSSTPITLGQQLRFLRKARGFSVKHISDTTDISSSIINMLEKDMYKTSVRNLLDYVRSIGCVIIVAPVPATGTPERNVNAKPFNLPLKAHDTDAD